MKYRGTIGIIFLLIVLLWVCTICCCVQQTAPQKQINQRQDSGLKDITEITASYPIHLEEVLEIMQDEKDTAGQNLSGYSIHYIQGDQVNVNGEAYHWMIGLKKGASKVFYYYESGESSLLSWSAWFPQDPIDLNLVMMPSCLISTEPSINSLVADQGNIKSIILEKTTYTVNIEKEGMISSVEYNALIRGPCPTITMSI